MRWALLLAGVVAGMPVHAQQVPDLPARSLAQLPPERLTGTQRLSAARWMVDQALSRPGDATWQRAWLAQASIYYAAALGDAGLSTDQRHQCQQALAAIDRYLNPPPEVIPPVDTPVVVQTSPEAFAPQVVESPRAEPTATVGPVEWMGPEEPARSADELARRSVQEPHIKPVLTPDPHPVDSPLDVPTEGTPNVAAVELPTAATLPAAQPVPVAVEAESPLLAEETIAGEVIEPEVVATRRLPLTPRIQELLASHQPGLHWEQGPVDHHDFGLATAMAVDQLLDAGLTAEDNEALARALDDLRGWSLSGTLSTAFRLMIACRLGGEWESIRQQDAQALWDAQRDGRWPPALRPRPEAVIDGCTQLHTYFAARALHEAGDERISAALPRIVMRTRREQRDDGGWSSWWSEPITSTSEREATLASAGLLALQPNPRDPSLQRARQWLAKHDEPVTPTVMQTLHQAMMDALAHEEAGVQ